MNPDSADGVIRALRALRVLTKSVEGRGAGCAFIDVLHATYGALATVCRDASEERIRVREVFNAEPLLCLVSATTGAATGALQWARTSEAIWDGPYEVIKLIDRAGPFREDFGSFHWLFREVLGVPQAALSHGRQALQRLASRQRELEVTKSTSLQDSSIEMIVQILSFIESCLEFEKLEEDPEEELGGRKDSHAEQGNWFVLAICGNARVLVSTSEESVFSCDDPALRHHFEGLLWYLPTASSSPLLQKYLESHGHIQRLDKVAQSRIVEEFQIWGEMPAWTQIVRGILRQLNSTVAWNLPEAIWSGAGTQRNERDVFYASLMSLAETVFVMGCEEIQISWSVQLFRGAEAGRILTHVAGISSNVQNATITLARQAGSEANKFAAEALAKVVLESNRDLKILDDLRQQKLQDLILNLMPIECPPVRPDKPLPRPMSKMPVGGFSEAPTPPSGDSTRTSPQVRGAVNRNNTVTQMGTPLPKQESDSFFSNPLMDQQSAHVTPPEPQPLRRDVSTEPEVLSAPEAGYSLVRRGLALIQEGIANKFSSGTVLSLKDKEVVISELDQLMKQISDLRQIAAGTTKEETLTSPNSSTTMASISASPDQVSSSMSARAASERHPGAIGSDLGYCKAVTPPTKTASFSEQQANSTSSSVIPALELHPMDQLNASSSSGAAPERRRLPEEAGKIREELRVAQSPSEVMALIDQARALGFDHEASLGERKFKSLTDIDMSRASQVG
eukprot:gnl/MRDRNA2_/MRDRNA2_133556_c0_seq1.p1 gnl/MRDRNA2_/MRDRNA2_133556_c0~~gnl/MRDRNA2_/MRDRNA2_133556_c0_seq1.p1  ORF type:complete len:749 (+),score=149.77 gnl/MRDRNA2_/MRDRNA2_133556_c0_seq1:37-2247(+)